MPIPNLSKRSDWNTPYAPGLNETMLHRIHGSLHAFGDIELAQDALYMNLDGGFRQVKHAGNFLVAGAMREHDDDFPLTRGEFARVNRRRRSPPLGWGA